MTPDSIMDAARMIAIPLCIIGGILLAAFLWGWGRKP